MIDVAESKEEFLGQIDVYGRNEIVRRTIDLAHLRRLVEAFPSPERMREEMRGGGNPTASASMIAAVHALAMAAYLEQHGGEGTAAQSERAVEEANPANVNADPE